MVFCLRQLQEKSREHRTPLHMAFIDLTKAFDTVSRPALWIVLEKLGLPIQMRQIIRSFHDGMLAQVIHGGKMSDTFSVENGTKQGCVLAPLLFALYFAVMLKHAQKKSVMACLSLLEFQVVFSIYAVSQRRQNLQQS